MARTVNTLTLPHSVVMTTLTLTVAATLCLQMCVTPVQAASTHAIASGAEKTYKSHLRVSCERAIEIAREGGNEHEVLEAINSVTNTEEGEALVFLLKYMPSGDLQTLTAQYILDTVQYALKARHDNAWATEVSWEMFLNDVLPHANVNEPRDAWRPLFYEKFAPLVKQAHNLTEAGLIINQKIWSMWSPAIHFVSDCTPDIMSPFQTIKAGHASCTGLSIFLVNACRSVGIPARVTGTPNWNTATGGNHDWVEVYDHVTGWSFTGASEYNGRLNSTWFYPHPAKSQLPGQDTCNGHSIFAASYSPQPQSHTDSDTDSDSDSGVFFPMAWACDDMGHCWSNSTYIPAVDRTLAYVNGNADTDAQTIHRTEQNPRGQWQDTALTQAQAQPQAEADAGAMHMETSTRTSAHDQSWTEQEIAVM
eukprot:GFYU01009150.1.p1 GENE.GFYU01009150.1~~GFYU01009150.1.p1  ORF type:complete len:449 (-),score=111.35 GFYU01009150.1:77-1339(-)